MSRAATSQGCVASRTVQRTLVDSSLLVRITEQRFTASRLVFRSNAERFNCGAKSKRSWKMGDGGARLSELIARRGSGVNILGSSAGVGVTVHSARHDRPDRSIMIAKVGIVIA